MACRSGGWRDAPRPGREIALALRRLLLRSGRRLSLGADDADRITYVSPGLKTMLGRVSSAIRQRVPAMVEDRVIADDIDAVRAVLADGPAASQV